MWSTRKHTTNGQVVEPYLLIIGPVIYFCIKPVLKRSAANGESGMGERKKSDTRLLKDLGR